jgi:hypothetical protein
MQKKTNPGQIVIFVVVIVALLGLVVAMNQMSERANKQNIEADNHDHDGDGKPDHGADAH